MSNRMKPKSPLRDALAKKTTLRTYFEVATAESEVVEGAQRRLDLARQLAAASLLSEDPDVRVKTDAAIASAEAERDACFHRIWFRGLGLTEFDALVGLHPATDAQRADDWSWNPDTFNYALLEAATVDSDLTAEDWETELSDEARWTAPDRRALISSCLSAQRQTMAEAVPKD